MRKNIVIILFVIMVFTILVGKKDNNLSIAGKENKYLLGEKIDNSGKVEKWKVNEVEFISDKEYENPFNDVELDFILTNGTITYTIPAFWDGGNVWRARFVCTEEGEWSYVTKCTDLSNESLNGRTASFQCISYSGDLEIYKHGFIKTDTDKRYLTYNDGTPFFYLGDTHWALGNETVSMVEQVSEKRANQGYTVIQSEPIGATFKCEDGITEDDIQGFQEFDEKFEKIADNGLVHANAEFFFPETMEPLIRNNGGYTSAEADNGGDLSNQAKEYLRKLSRYWVARYSAYPVIWTLGQEVDNDYYWDRDTNKHRWNSENNPYIIVAEYIEKYDAYKHPLSAHQEYTGNTQAHNSAFKDVSSHTWWAAQWSPSIKNNIDYNVPKDYWENGQGKPIINYEGRYCYYWTKNFGSRAQGWISYLNGMFGYGWGGQGTWWYAKSFETAGDTFDGVDNITAEEKQSATWKDALEYESSYQVGYMHNFFEDLGDWYNLIPRFDNTKYFEKDENAYAVIASNENNTKTVIYFYNFSDKSIGENPNVIDNGTATGTLKNLQPNELYYYKWFNPVTGEYIKTGNIMVGGNGEFKVPDKETSDMVFYIYSDNEAPKIEGVENGKTYEKVTPTVVDDYLSTVVLKKDGIIQENYKNGDEITEIGDYELTATDESGNTTTVNFKVFIKTIQQIEVSTNPTKVKYIQNYETLDLTGGELTVKYNDGTTDTISLTNDMITVTGFDNSSLGTKRITVQYEGKQTIFEIEIISKSIQEIELESKPLKTNYIQNYEQLDLTGGKLTVKYNDGTIDTISLTNDMITVTGFDNSSLGTKRITVQYEGKQITFEIEIISKSIQEIKLTTVPIKTKYIQNSESLDLTGGILTVIYTDNSIDTISLTNENVAISGFDNSKTGINTIIVEYEGESLTFDVEVISILKDPSEENNNLDKNENVEKENLATKILPYAGARTIFFIVVIMIITVIISYILYRKYKI